MGRDHKNIENHWSREIKRSHILLLIVYSNASTIIKHNDKEESDLFMRFIYKDYTNSKNDVSIFSLRDSFQNSQLQFYLNSLEWWITQEDKYPVILVIPQKNSINIGKFREVLLNGGLGGR